MPRTQGVSPCFSSTSRSKRLGLSDFPIIKNIRHTGFFACHEVYENAWEAETQKVPSHPRLHRNTPSQKNRQDIKKKKLSMRIRGNILKYPLMSGAYTESTYFAEQAVSPAIRSCFPGKLVCRPGDSQRGVAWRQCRHQLARPSSGPFYNGGLARTAYKDGSPSDDRGTETLHPDLGWGKDSVSGLD